MFNRISAVASITFWEGIRNRSVYGVFLFALMIFGFNTSVAGFFMRDVGKVAVDINLAAITFAGLLLVFFVGLNLISKDIDRKTVQIVLSKPISRTEYIFGKFLGIQFFLLISLTLLFMMSIATISLLNNIYANYFLSFKWLNYIVANFFIFVKLGVVNAVMILFSSLTTNSFIALIFSVSVYIVGESIEDVVFFIKNIQKFEGSLVTPFLIKIINIISYLVPNLTLFDYKLEASHGLPLMFLPMLSSVGYGLIYILIVLFVGSMVFQKREFF